MISTSPSKQACFCYQEHPNSEPGDLAPAFLTDNPMFSPPLLPVPLVPGAALQTWRARHPFTFGFFNLYDCEECPFTNNFLSNSKSNQPIRSAGP
jgi:hypothetical protein